MRFAFAFMLFDPGFSADLLSKVVETFCKGSCHVSLVEKKKVCIMIRFGAHVRGEAGPSLSA